MPQAIKVDKSHIKECMIEMLSDMFGSDCIGKLIRGNTISVTVDDKVATVNVESLVSSYFTAMSTQLTICLLAGVSVYLAPWTACPRDIFTQGGAVQGWGRGAR